MKIFKLIMGVALLPLLQGCSDSPVFGDVQIGEGSMELKYTVETDIPLTRGVVAQPNETSLKQVHVLFFDPEDNDNFVAYKSVTPSSGKNTFKLDPPETLARNHSYRVLAVGNGDSYKPMGRLSFNDYLATFSGTYNDAVAELLATASEAVTRDKPGTLPLCGTFEKNDNSGESTFTVTDDPYGNPKVDESESATFIFKRGICRFDIYNLVGNVLDIRYARVVNDRDAGFLFHDGQVAGAIKPYSPVSDPSQPASGYRSITQDVEPGVNTTQRMEAMLYGMPNIVNRTVVNDKVTTALMIAGYYINPETGVKSDKLTYYRFNMANLGESQILNRNYCYRATIKGVKREGAPTEDEAYNSTTPIFDYDVDDEWQVTDDNVATDRYGNFLIVNKSHLTFDGEANQADNIELRVSTNPGMDWVITPVAQPGHQNDKFVCNKTSEQSILVGPNSVNDTPYVRYGYYQITATNRQTGVKLSVRLYLQQLTTRDNVKMLTVNDNTGTFTQSLNPRGGTVQLRVNTGTKGNMWTAADSNSLTSWSNEATYTKSGDNGGIIEIYVPANVTGGTRTANIVVRLVNDNVVQPVTIHLEQKKSDQIIFITNEPSNGTLTLNCLDFTPGNPNGIVQPRSFPVTLADPTLVYRVTSSFDKDRDLCLSQTNSLGPNGGTASSVTASHPVAGAAESANEKLKLNKIEGLTSGQTFVINPFRMGPDDDEILGTITVQAYRTSAPNTPLETRSFTVRLCALGATLNDVIWNIDGYYVIFADRNYGSTSRISKNDNGVIVNTPGSYYDYRTNIKIGKTYPYNNTGLKGVTTYCKSTGNGYYAALSPNLNTSLAIWKTNNANVNEYYSSATYSWITHMSANMRKKIIGNAVYTKNRVFLVSDYKTTGGSTVCAWLQFTDYSHVKNAQDVITLGIWNPSKLNVSNQPMLNFNTLTGATTYSEWDTRNKGNFYGIVRPYCSIQISNTEKTKLMRTYGIIIP